jgi:hypothetical protein
MSDASVHAALRSEAPLVVVEAPAGCGKTHQGADYARDIAPSGAGRLLILTHTHAACSVFAERTRRRSSHVEIRTFDSLIGQVATIYHAGLGLPADTATWARQNREGYAQIALKVAALFKRFPMVPATLARRYPVVICDEHQDCSGDQHTVNMALLTHGSRIRVFGDPMQRIYKEKALIGASTPCNWEMLTRQAGAFERLDTPHRWSGGCIELGKWTLRARKMLKTGGKINLQDGLPPSIGVVFAENRAPKKFDYQLSTADRRQIDLFERAQASLLVLTHFNKTARSIRAFFNRRIPLWEGHIRSGLEALVDAINAGRGNPSVLAAAFVRFLNDIGKGFSPSAFGNRFEKEVREGCSVRASGKSAAIQALAHRIIAEPDHRGIAKALSDLAALKRADSNFAGIEIDCRAEFLEAIRLGGFADADKGFAEITHCRTYSRPKPPDKAISTIHKAKGIKCNSVIIMPCDAETFPDTLEARCLLYVALSRAKDRLLLVASRNRQSPLLII